MYSQFCKNLNNFIAINKTGNEGKNLRLKYAMEILPLAHIDDYLKYKDIDKINYTKLGNFIFDITKYKQKYPSLERLTWELWAYGFDIIPYEKNDDSYDKCFEEKVKIIDLMMSTHYF